MSKWYQVAVAGGVAVGVAGILYHLMRETPQDTQEDTEKSNSGGVVKGGEQTLDVATATQQQVLKILERVVKSQEEMKTVMKRLIKELVQKELDFDEVYEKVKTMQPDDPLEATGLSLADFDHLLNKFENDREITEAVNKIMGLPGPVSFSAAASSLSCDDIVEIHKRMLQEITTLVEAFQKLPKRDEYDMKTVTIAVQAIVGARIEKSYKVCSEDIEAAVLLHHQTLACNREFATINVQMQSTMSYLMGCQTSSKFP